MTMPSKPAFLLAAAASLSACAQLPAGRVYPAVHAQQLDAGNSMLGKACFGTDVALSTELRGHTRMVVAVDVAEVTGGAEVPWSSVSAPSDEGISQMAHPVFSGKPGPAACGGMALRTIERRERGVMYLDYQLELAPPGGSGSVPTDPWLVRGRAPVDEIHGTATDAVAFHAFGRSFVARVNATPGPAWIREQRARDAAQAMQQYPRVATPLADEKSDRTLEDMLIRR